MSYDGLPGFVEERQAHGEATVVVERERLLDAALHCRDELGFNVLADIAAADYLGWGSKGIAGYWGTAGGRDINAPGSWGLQRTPRRNRSDSRSATTCSPSGTNPLRVRLQVWCDDGEPVESVISVWPTADWHEREAWEMLGIRIEGHPNLVRLLTEDDWEGHPLRKDYPLGGEPVRFSDAE